MVNGERVKQARELRGFTQTELAKRINDKQSKISQIESGYKAASQEVLEAIAFQTGFPISFFRQTASIEFPLGSLLFRAKTSLTSRERDMARQYGKLVLEIAEKMETHISKLPLRLPRLSNIDPVNAAQLTRSELGLSPDTPIQNLISVLEKNGVLVLVLPVSISDHDAYSVWTITDESRPVMVVSGETSGDRLRFSIAHELGHLVMHHSIKGDISVFEQEANRFAGEFLVPELAARQEMLPPITLFGLSQLKPKWKVSIQALCRRAMDLEIITYRQYTYLMQQISIRGWRKREPSNLDVPVERPRAISQMAEMLYGNPIDYKNLSEDMLVPIQLTKDIFEAYTAKTIEPTNEQLKVNGKVIYINSQSTSNK